MKINLIPMAGEGLRYKNAGYTIPKPMIEVDGLPMVVRAARSLPTADSYIFVCRDHHLTTYPIRETLKKYFDEPIIITTDELTEGQAMTCMLAKDHIPSDAVLTIGASDNDMTYDQLEIEEMFSNNDIDGWIWTFRNNSLVLQDPTMYGWVKCENNSSVAINVSCKKPISENVLQDHAIIGAFTFKRADIFFDAVESMVEANERINNEFYVDVAADFAIRAGNQIHVFDVQQYIGWGTPEDYDKYNYWLEYFKKRLH